ncbi:hypothetical protein DFH27DRAFT_605710 [Peziza echinospora]|nr:hypothetical protein DFH27DRAFT_605710 [Peziza echinospora]
MDDIDAELLALAGAEAAAAASSGGGGGGNTRKRSEPPTSSASPVKSKKVKKGTSAGAASGKKGRRRGGDSDEDEEEEGEESELSEAPESDLSEGEEEEERHHRPSASSNSRSNNYHSAYASESSEDDEEENIFELYPYEGTYKDAADKAKLLAMSEIEREAVLAERATEIERAMQDRHLRTLLKSQSRAAANSGNNADKNNGGNTSGGDSGGGGATRRSTRAQNMPQAKKLDSKKGKLDEMKRAREERNTRKDKPGSSTHGDDEGTSRRRSLADLLDDDDDDRAPFAEELYVKKKEEREVDLQDINRARIGRTGFTKLCDYPGFEETIIDCFVRVSLFDRDTGRNAYRVAQIKGITTGKPYSLLDNKRRTDKHLQLVQGKAERSFPMDLMSDGNITEAEFQRFKAQLNVDSMPLPSLSLVRRKANDLRALDSRTFTPEEVSAMIAKRNKGKVDTVSLFAQRSHLKELRATAVLAGDTDEMRRLDKEIHAIEDMSRKALKGSYTADDGQSKLAKHNASARQRNRKEIREAELEEKRKARLHGDVKPGSEFYNPFQRVKTKAKVMHVEEKKGEMMGKEEVVKTVTEQVAKTTLGAGRSEAEGPPAAGKPVVGEKGKKKGIDDVIASMDFGIEIDI